MINDLVVSGVTYQPARWTVYNNWINGGCIPVNGGDSAVVAPNLGSMLRNVFDGGAFHEGHTLSFGAAIVVDTGDGTSNQNVYRDGTPVRVRHNA